MTALKYIFVIIAAYLCGSFSTSVFISTKLYGIDVRNYGSGNAGATNTLRTLGLKKALVVLLGDALKVVVAILIARFAGIVYPELIAGMAAIIGHAKPIFYGFKGGKGVACALGFILMFDLLMPIVVLPFFFLAFFMTKIISVATFTAVGAALVYIFVRYWGDPVILIFFSCLGAYIIWLHKANVKRLIAGTESKIDFKAKLLKDVEKKQ
ncbi:MAG: glycerol-3-phosphate 1-O-acyltransferase PlsY [Clostridia bacterium]|nr:glycerol-3-phosphate 1-O-acyltransferase PlsY [Clostridia bacterium]